MQIQRQFSMKNLKKNQQRQRVDFSLQQNMFPQLPVSKNGIAFRGQQLAGHNPQPGPSTQKTSQPKTSYSQQVRKFPSNPNNFLNPNKDDDIPNDLFSFDELMQLVNELIGSISPCSTRMEQFQIMTNLDLKYVYGQSR